MPSAHLDRGPRSLRQRPVTKRSWSPEVKRMTLIEADTARCILTRGFTPTDRRYRGRRYGDRNLTRWLWRQGFVRRSGAAATSPAVWCDERGTATVSAMIVSVITQATVNDLQIHQLTPRLCTIVKRSDLITIDREERRSGSG